MDTAFTIEIAEEGPLDLPDYASVSIAFEVSEIVDVPESTTALGGLEISERKVRFPYVKDYDQLPGEAPTQWPLRFDLSNWGLFGARLDRQRVGSAAVAFDTPGLDLLERRRDLALLWDIRVDPRSRGRGVGSALFRAVESWARARACRTLKVETQNTNVLACRFYARRGCVLREVHRFAYAQLPDEIQMLYYRDLSPDG